MALSGLALACDVGEKDCHIQVISETISYTGVWTVTKAASNADPMKRTKQTAGGQ